MEITINKPFREQYVLHIKSSLMAVNAVMESTTQIRWDFEVIRIQYDEIEIRLLLLEQNLLETNNPLTKEVAALTSLFASIYNELHLKINQKGKILEILNTDILFDKWNKTKVKLAEIAKHTPELNNVVKINDDLFMNEMNLVSSLQQSEFFMVYFNSVFGNILPYYTTSLRMPNFLNTALLNWDVNVTATDERYGDLHKIELKAKPIFMQSDYNERAYSQFADKLDITKIVAKIKEEGTYLIDTDKGRVEEATLVREEIADSSQLFLKAEYHFMSYGVYRKSIAQQTMETQQV